MGPGPLPTKRLVAYPPRKKDGGGDDEDDNDKKPPPSKRQAPTASGSSSKRKKAPPTFVYILVYMEGGPYREEFEPKIPGAFSSKQLAMENAKRTFETYSDGFYIDGAFTEPDIFDKTQDNTNTIGESGVLLYQKDREGEWKKLSLVTKQLDEHA